MKSEIYGSGVSECRNTGLSGEEATCRVTYDLLIHPPNPGTILDALRRYLVKHKCIDNAKVHLPCCRWRHSNAACDTE